ncbi:unnamed protein product [Alopecurus aequalis]
MASSPSSSSAAPSCSSFARSSFKPRPFPDFSFVFDMAGREDVSAARIFAAARAGDIPRMKELAKHRKMEGKNVEVVEEIKDTGNNSLGALHVAAFYGETKMCKFLIKHLHLDVNATAQDGSSPLMCAIYGSAPEPIVKLLLGRGADPNIASRNSFTVLHALATKQGLLEIADILLSRGAHVDYMSECGTPLHCAAQCGHVEMMKLLLKYKADPNRVLHFFYTPLILALYAKSLKSVELLIKAGADVNAGKPVTPLVEAAWEGLTDCIKCLLGARADPNISDEFGRMPVEIAANHGWKECVEILFPVTSPVAKFADWSVAGIMQHVKSQSSEGHLHKSEEPALKARGDAAFERKDYPHASALYTKAMDIDPKDSTLYAKRSLCWLHMGEKHKALDDANTCKGMGLHEEGSALLLTEDYAQAYKALMSSLKLDSGSGTVGEVSREEDK